MVHHTMSASSKPAPKDSSKISSMFSGIWVGWSLPYRAAWSVAIVGMLVSCASSVPRPVSLPMPSSVPPVLRPESVKPAPLTSPPLSLPTVPQAAPRFEPPVKGESKSRWVPVPIEDLPGWPQESMAEVWTLLLANCDINGTVLAPLCSDIRRLSIASETEQRLLLLNRLQALPFEQAVVVSLNPIIPIAADKILGAYDYAHPVFDLAALDAQNNMHQIQGRNHTWFAGAWMGYGFHEDGLKAGLSVARELLLQVHT